MPVEVFRLSDSQTLERRRSDADTFELTSTGEPSTKPPPMHWHRRRHEKRRSS